MFDRARSHLPVSTRTARLLVAGVLALVTTIAAVRLAPRAAADDDACEAAAKSKEPSPQVAKQSKPWRVTVRVVDSDDVAIAGARVRVLRVDIQEVAWSESGHVVAEGRTDDNGVLALDYEGQEHGRQLSCVKRAGASTRAPANQRRRQVQNRARSTRRFVCRRGKTRRRQA